MDPGEPDQGVAGFQTPLWVMTDLEPEKGLEMYLKGMKIEESFCDGKDLLGLEQLMNKQQAKLEQMVALTLRAYVVGLFIGEAVREVSDGNLKPEEMRYQTLVTTPENLPPRTKWKLYSGLVVLLKQQLRISPKVLRQLQRPVAQACACLLLDDVRSPV